MEDMKNLLVHITPNKRFNKEHSIMAKIQIDNAYRMGWKPEDVLIVTNFPYEYNGIKAMVIDDIKFCDFRPRSMKTLTVAHMLQHNLIDNDIYWVHDFDAYQEQALTPDMKNKDFALTTYGWNPQWSLGSYFVKRGACYIFQWIREAIYDMKVEDEKALMSLTKNNLYDINSKYTVINETYNFGMRYIKKVYPKAEKPLKVVHFHLWGKDMPAKDMFLNGKNEINIPLVSDELKKIFNKHGVR